MTCSQFKALMILMIALVSIASAVPVPVNYAAGQDPRISESLFVGNYEAGASLSESYTHAEHLDRNTEVRTRSYGPSSPKGAQGSLEASINSNVVGVAHIAWQSVEHGQDGRPYSVGRSVEDLTGVFSIEKFIQLWSNMSAGQVSVDWMPCM